MLAPNYDYKAKIFTSQFKNLDKIAKAAKYIVLAILHANKIRHILMNLVYNASNSKVLSESYLLLKYH